MSQPTKIKSEKTLSATCWHELIRVQLGGVESISKLEEQLGYQFCNRRHLYEALTHKSCLTNDFKELPWNERLEFLGDAVLGLCISSLLWQRYGSSTDEGVLSRARAALVSERALAQMGRDLLLHRLLLVSSSERQVETDGRESLLADAVEAIIGAVFLDSNFDCAQQVVKRMFEERINEIVVNGVEIDFKTQLQEVFQAELQQAPTYVLVDASGPDHCRHFEVAVVLGKRRLGCGIGSSKKRASQDAAKNALQILAQDCSTITGIDLGASGDGEGDNKL